MVAIEKEDGETQDQYPDNDFKYTIYNGNIEYTLLLKKTKKNY